ncbi:MAG: exonuclease domain-containing protein [Eubacterium sp.]|nr:exonuclease domain-containing protein [Eubacterium sp.]
MNYVVFDLEWNQSPYGKAAEIERLPFEIIEIGAVKLNDEREVVDTFQVIIKPTVYRRLNYRTREIVHMKQSELDDGIWFPDAVRDFLAWAGPDSVFCTWGTVDLPELQRNMKYYQLLHLLKGPLHYYDVQKLFAIQYEDMKSRRSLEYGTDFLHLPKAEAFHRALADASYTAEIFRTIDNDIILAYDSLDVYQNPRTKTEEIHLVYNGYSKFISREFESKEQAMADKEVLATPCCLCGRSSHKKIRWFSVNARNYYCVAVCPEHGLEKGKIRMKHNDDGGVYVVKTIKVTNEPEVESIRKKKNDLREKRRRRRH